MSDIINRGEIVSFTVYPSTIIGTKYKDVKVLSILDYTTAKAFADVDALHRNVYPTLPNTVPNNPSQYYYARLEFVNGTTDIVGLPWIEAGSVVVKSAQSLQLSFKNISPVDQNRLIQVIQANGFTIDAVNLLT